MRRDPDPNIWWLFTRRLEDSKNELDNSEEEKSENIGELVEIEIIEGSIDSEIDSECEEYCEEEESEGESDDSEEDSLNSSDIAREQEEYECIGYR